MWWLATYLEEILKNYQGLANILDYGSGSGCLLNTLVAIANVYYGSKLQQILYPQDFSKKLFSS